jgi:hypothetical protein
MYRLEAMRNNTKSHSERHDAEPNFKKVSTNSGVLNAAFYVHCMFPVSFIYELD